MKLVKQMNPEEIHSFLVNNYLLMTDTEAWALVKEMGNKFTEQELRSFILKRYGWEYAKNISKKRLIKEIAHYIKAKARRIAHKK